MGLRTVIYAVADLEKAKNWYSQVLSQQPYLAGGADWAKEIEKAVHQANIAVLLITPSFLASDFIVTRELPALLKRRQQEGLVIPPP